MKKTEFNKKFKGLTTFNEMTKSINLDNLFKAKSESEKLDLELKTKGVEWLTYQATKFAPLVFELSEYYDKNLKSQGKKCDITKESFFIDLLGYKSYKGTIIQIINMGKELSLNSDIFKMYLNQSTLQVDNGRFVISRQSFIDFAKKFRIEKTKQEAQKKVDKANDNIPKSTTNVGAEDVVKNALELATNEAIKTEVSPKIISTDVVISICKIADKVSIDIDGKLTNDLCAELLKKLRSVKGDKFETILNASKV